MTAAQLLADAASRPLDAVRALRPHLTPETLNAHVGRQPNSVAWLLWHLGREIDVQVADLGGHEQVWTAQGFAARLGLGDGIGYGQSAEEARAVRSDDADGLLDYVAAATRSLQDYLATLDDVSLDDVIDDSWDPPVTRGVRLVSVIDDAAQHAGQAAYALGALDG